MSTLKNPIPGEHYFDKYKKSEKKAARLEAENKDLREVIRKSDANKDLRAENKKLNKRISFLEATNSRQAGNLRHARDRIRLMADSREVLLADRIRALAHEDYCCTKGCPGPGQSCCPASAGGACDGRCHCFLEPVLRVIEEVGL
jgi:regulator of replication initiation timing